MSHNKDKQDNNGYWSKLKDALLTLTKGVGLLVVGIIVVGIIVLGTVLITLFFSTFSTEATTKLSSDLLEDQIQEVQELTTTKSHYTNAGAFENQNQVNGWNVPFTKKNFIMTYSGIIHAGINLEEVKVEMNESETLVTLPEVRILSHEIDQESINVLDEESSIFNPIKIDDYKAFSIDQENVIEAQALERGLLNTATNQARDAITTVLQLNPMVEEAGYNIVFN